MSRIAGSSRISSERKIAVAAKLAFEGMTGKAIGEEIGVSEVRVSQMRATEIWKQTISRLENLEGKPQTEVEIQQKLTYFDRRIEQSRQKVDVCTAGYVYLLSAVGTNIFKIGKSKASVLNRLKDLQTSSPIKLRYVYHAYVKNYSRCEIELHRKFSERRQIGEWFTLTTAEVKECILLMRLAQEIEPINVLVDEETEGYTEEDTENATEKLSREK